MPRSRRQLVLWNLGFHPLGRCLAPRAVTNFVVHQPIITLFTAEFDHFQLNVNIMITYRSLIWGLRILEGRTLSVNEADEIKLDRGFKALKKTDITRSRKLIIEGLSMLEGCVPICLLVPAIHTLCHYPGGAEQWGLLRLLWMICFGKYP